ncbi:MAG TPA: lipopolysaccharide biosynthesis protein [Kofleriaceae bacterium]|nr:lipopolysaccharide biosynthesis protein [Kofleriaceae bacterium]
MGRKAHRGLKWSLAGTICTNVVRLVTIPVLGRLISPAEFGLVAAALVIIAFGQVVRDVGMGAAIVQRETLTRPQIDAAASFSVIFGTAVGLVVFAAAPVVARLDDSPSLTAMIRALAAMFVIRSLGTVPRALCQRDLEFRALTIIDFGSYFAGSVVTIVLAAMGASVWALIIGYLVESVTSTAAVFVLRPTRLRWTRAIADSRGLFHFGLGSTLGDLASYFANNGDYMIVGYSLGNEPLGLYTRAYELMRFPSAVFSNVAGFVLFSAFSRLQGSPERLGRAFRHGTFLTAVILLPASAALIVVAPEMIRLLLGNGWGEAVFPFQILAASMMARTAFKIGLTLARGAGAVYAVAIASGMNAVLVFVGAAIGSHWGIVGVSVAISIECTLQYVWFCVLGLKQTTLGWPSLVAIHVEAVLAAVVGLAAVIPIATGLRSIGASDAVIVIGCGVAGLFGLMVAAVIGKVRSHADWLWIWEAARNQLLRRQGATRSA